MSATLKVTREVGFGFELRRCRFEISVDGNSVGSLDNHETVETPLKPGRHTIRIRNGRAPNCGSRLVKNTAIFGLPRSLSRPRR